ncbi:pyridoxal phosphate phosphatase PHOSPHO2 isoform X2 [Astyanax mexicanus]|uniref:pyridoxal phosphate phosphatase PHOSPHO2 isoform X2 n=2 Tax=Astyanax mexicanus TaxID=7994 RepID=UPI0020CB223A|nr:pyridoxal phosphate phosphatase PHOSPHO2 isoform X2 [Astyanax mexicanus]
MLYVDGHCRYIQPVCIFREEDSVYLELAKMKTLVVFDFDHTLVDDNSDTWVIRCAPEQSLPAWLKNSYEKGRWTEYMGRVLSYLRDQSVQPDTIRSVMETIPFTDGMVELLTFISQSKSEIDCIIVSDSNTLFIDWILQARGLKNAIDSVFTNPASVNNEGCIGVQCFHSHQCDHCPVNLCKQKVLSDFTENQANSGIHYQAVCYVGDGGNDFCPVKVLKETDLVMPRKGYTLEKLLLKASSENVALKPQVVPWSNGNEILEQLQKLVQQ